MLDRSSVLSMTGVVHGFTTRAGGVSEGRYATLNLGRRWGDDSERVDENLRRVGAEAGFDPSGLCLVRQVHGNSVVRACDATTSSEADAVWMHRDDRGPRAVGVLTADCVPVLIVDGGGTMAAAVHSGWRGTVAAVVPAAVAVLADAGAERTQIRAAIGPCIELAAFEVGPEVASRFEPRHVDRDGHVRPHVDLVGAVRAQLIDAGLSEHNVERVGSCTYTHDDRYFSYRRDGAGVGQHLAFVGLV